MAVTVLNYHVANFYLIQAATGLLLVDADMAGTLPLMFRSLGEAGMRVQDIRYLFCTHYDPDHAGIAQDLRAHGVDLVLLDVQMPHIQRQDAIFAKNPRTPFTPVTTKGAITSPARRAGRGWRRWGWRAKSSIRRGTRMTARRCILDGVGAFVGDLPRLQDAPAWNDPVIDAGWRAVMRHAPPLIYPGHGPAYLPQPKPFAS